MSLSKDKIKSLVSLNKSAHNRKKMIEGEDYYNFKHDILNYRMFYTDNEGNIKEEFNRSNIKIAHAFFTELVDQKVDYLLSNPVQIKTDETTLEEYLKGYIRPNWQKVLRSAVKWASIKAKSYVYAYYDDNNQLRFGFVDASGVIPIHGDYGEVESIVRHYDKDIQKDERTIKITVVEYWTAKEVTYYVIRDGQIELDVSQRINPRPHRVVIDPETQTMYGKSMGTLPFYEFINGDNVKTDLEPIKALIDDYDLMACALSNNLTDFDHPLLAVKGYPDENLDSIINDLKTRKTVGVSEDGGLDVKTVEIPTEGRGAKLNVDKESIYRFGRGFDSTKVGDGNITNVVIQSRYSLLELKCNEIETHLLELIEWMLKFIFQDIQEKHGRSFELSDTEIEITRSIMVNEKDNADIEESKARTEQIRTDTLLTVAPRLDNDTVLAQICDKLNLDFQEVKRLLSTQDYTGDVEGELNE